MEGKGTLKAASKDLASGKLQVVFELESDLSGQLEGIQGKPLRISAKRWREKRSLDANAYYWVLVGKLAEAQHVSTPRMHNLLLRRYGQNMVIDGQGVYIRIPDTEKAEETALESSEFHIRPTSEVVSGRDTDYRTYVVLLGSSAYDTAQMSRLIDGAVSECKECGIETLTPDELERMMQTYEAERKRRYG